MSTSSRNSPVSSLVGRAYESLFPEAVPRGDSTTAWTVLEADLGHHHRRNRAWVHTAVMYGEDDYNLGMEAGLPAYHTVGNGRLLCERDTPRP